jgi:hypothetical protein
LGNEKKWKLELVNFFKEVVSIFSKLPNFGKVGSGK